MYRGLGADTNPGFVPENLAFDPTGSMTSTTTTFDTGANALIAAGYGDSSTTVDTSTGLPLYVASPSNLVPSVVPASGAKSTTTISPMLIAGGAGLLLLLVVMGGRRR